MENQYNTEMDIEENEEETLLDKMNRGLYNLMHQSGDNSEVDIIELREEMNI